MQPELQAVVGYEATQLMRFETEHRGYRDMVGVRADCLAAALDGWKRRGETAAQRHAINTINNFFDIAQMSFTATTEETPMLDLAAEQTDIYTEVAEETAARLSAALGDPVPVEVQTFESNFGKTRVVMFSDGTPWFVAKDVCEALGMNISKGASNLTWRLHNGQKMKAKLPLISNRGQTLDLGEAKMVRHLLLINRGGFNDMVLESRKPVAREYRQWITDTVMPALQDTGTFTDEGHPEQQLEGSPTLSF